MSETASVDTNFVVYAYMRKNGTPYYIGKGRPERPYKDLGRPCKKPSDKSRIVILHENIDEQTAFRIEIELIAKYKRKDLYPEDGLLYNKSDGGEGASGTIVSEKTRKKQSESRKGKNNYNYKPRDWYHPEHGEVLQKSSRELVEIFPDMGLNEGCLNAVYRGEKTNNKGWKRLKDKNLNHRRKNNIPRDWYHEEYGEIKNTSITELVKKYPEQKLSVSALCTVAKGENISHKGWHLLKNKDKKPQNYKPLDWYHPDYGIFLNKTGSELALLFPEQQLDSKCLNRVSLGKSNHHKGWRIYKKEGNNPNFVPKHNKYKPVNWFHFLCGEVRGKSLSELKDMFPEQDLHTGSLSQLANKKLKQYKGWRLLEV
jgi:hypothetical protein